MSNFRFADASRQRHRVSVTCSNAPRVTIDFESRNRLPIKVGAWKYSLHESCEPMCLAYKIGDGDTRLWHPGYEHLGIVESPRPDDLFDAIADGWLVEAHNRFFEFCMWSNVMVPRWDWPEIPKANWRCSAAKASYYGLPRSLADAVDALRLPIRKDVEGNRLMMKLCKPRKPSKAERSEILASGRCVDDVVLWHESVEDFERNWLYCTRDVDAEHAFSEVLPDLPPHELRVWQMDQDINLRGIRCDLDMVRQAIRLRDREVRLMNAELAELTNDAVLSGTSRKAFREWIETRGLKLDDTKGDTLDKLVTDRTMDCDVRAVVKIVREVNRSSTAKYDTMLERADGRDWRLRDLMMYHGANTGRWAGKGVQPHNFVRGNIRDMRNACQLVVDGDYEAIRALYGEVMMHLSYTLRGALTASVGRRLMVADYAAIEARVVFWLAGDGAALDVFRRGEDIYCDMATGIYGYEVKKKQHPDERQFGKQAVLGLGFEMGFVTFLLTLKKYNISFTEAEARKIVGNDWDALKDSIEKYFLTDRKRVQRMRDAELSIRAHMHELVLMQYTVGKYRGRYPEVRQMWRDQEEAAIAAIKHEGRVFECRRGRNSWVVQNVGGLHCLVTYLPSGKPLFYWEPRLVRRRTPFKDWQGNPVSKEVIVFMSKPEKGKGWVPRDTYGGKLVENITQATARDLLAYAMVGVDDSEEYDVLLSVHDELICETDEDRGDLKEFERLMARTPRWAEGCPIEAEGWSGFRYRK